MGAAWRAGLAGLALAWLPTAAARAQAPLPDARQVQQVLAASPAVAAAAYALQAEQAGGRALRAGPGEWTVSGSGGRRRYVPTQPGGREWDLALERPWRSAGKAQAATALGDARVAQAALARDRAWREQARLLLEGELRWLQAREQARVWRDQVELLGRQAQAVTRRRQLGDAAEVERLQAQAALAQAEAQWQLAQGRAQAERALLLATFAGLQPGDEALPPPAEPAALAVAVLVQASVELRAAEREVQVAAAQARVDDAERTPAPTLGMRVGGGPSPGERVVALTFSVPLGGTYRQATAQASAARLAAAGALRDEVARRTAAEAGMRLRERALALANWQREADAAAQLARSADAVARGYALGEGSLTDVLVARRAANDQGLAASLAAVAAWAAVWRAELEAGRLWPAPS
ncbi:MAG: TolC family protein [Burkholderiales bacterium]|nr:TolC family protein [Burkholderiales bacterium]